MNPPPTFTSVLSINSGQSPFHPRASASVVRSLLSAEAPAKEDRFLL